MKKLYILLASFGTLAAFAQPANDDCTAAIPVQVNADYNCGIVQHGTLAGATASNVPDNGSGTPSDDVWFSFVATSTTHKFSMLNRQGDETDLVHEILVGSCDGLQSINISDPETSTVNNLVIGTTYYIRVFSYWAEPAETTTFDVCIGSPPAPPVNDDCMAAIALTVNEGLQCVSTTSGILAGATPSNVSDNGAGTPNDDVWYTFTATATSHAVTLSNIQGSPTDLVHEVMAGTCDGLQSLNISDPNSSIVSGLTIGTTYYVRVFSYGSSPAESTTFDLCIGTPPSMTNDDCFDPIALTVNPDLECGVVTAGTLNGATPSNAADNGAGTPDDDVWFSFVATAASHKIELLNVSGNDTDLVHEVLSGSCESLSSLSISDPNTSIVAGLTPGNTYYVRVFTYSETIGANTIFNVCVGTLPPPPANDECANAVAITPAGTLAGSAIDGTVSGATASQGAPAPGCASYSGGDIWYSTVVPVGGNLTIETLAPTTGETTFDSGMAVYSGTCGALTLIDCDDDDADTGNFSKIVLTGRTPGEVVYIRVWEYSNDETEPFAIGAYSASLAAPSFDQAGFSIYPNPTSDVLNLSYANNIETVEVFNLLGQQVFAKAINQADYTLNMSNLPAGTYLVKMTADGASKTVKVLKK